MPHAVDHDEKWRNIDPFTEAKEVIGGFALIQARSREEAVEWGARFAEVIGDVEVEVRQVAKVSDVQPGAPSA